MSSWSWSEDDDGTRRITLGPGSYGYTAEPLGGWNSGKRETNMALDALWAMRHEQGLLDIVDASAARAAEAGELEADGLHATLVALLDRLVAAGRWHIADGRYRKGPVSPPNDEEAPPSLLDIVEGFTAALDRGEGVLAESLGPATTPLFDAVVAAGRWHIADGRYRQGPAPKPRTVTLDGIPWQEYTSTEGRREWLDGSTVEGNEYDAETFHTAALDRIAELEAQARADE